MLQSKFSHTSLHRRPEYQIRTQLFAQANSTLTANSLFQNPYTTFITKTATTSAAIPHLKQIITIHQQIFTHLHLKKETPQSSTSKFCQLLQPYLLSHTSHQIRFSYHPAPTLTQLIEQALLSKNFSAVFGYFDLYLCAINQFSQTTIDPYQNQDFVQLFDSKLTFKKSQNFLAQNLGLIDLTCSNLLLQNQLSPTLYLIDQEWLSPAPLPLNFLLFRNLYDLSSRLQSLIQLHLSPTFPGIQIHSNFYIPRDWLLYFKLQPADLATFLHWEFHWQNTLNLKQSSQPLCLINQTKYHEDFVSTPATLAAKTTQLQTSVHTLTQELTRAEKLLNAQPQFKTQIKTIIYRTQRFFQRPAHYLSKIYTREKFFVLNHGFGTYPARLLKIPLFRLFLYRFRPKDQLAVLRPTAKIEITKKKLDHSHLNILIIAGAAHTVSHIHRVSHFTEKLQLLGHQFTIFDHQKLAHLSLKNIDQYDVLYIHRATSEPLIDTLVDNFHQKQLPIIFDIDDLVFDPIVLPQIAAAREFSPQEFQIFSDTTQKHFQLMQKATHLTCPTQYLAEYIRSFFKEYSLYSIPPQITVLPNHLDQNSLDLAQKIAHIKLKKLENLTKITINETKIQQLLTINSQLLTNDKVAFTLGYFPGTNTHDQDFALIAQPLHDFLQSHPQARLKIVGDLTLPPELAPFLGTHQLLLKSKVPYSQLMFEYQDVDLNLAPLEENAFCQAKSELKYFFAGACGLPTLSSPTQPFVQALTRSRGGQICYTSADWLTQFELFFSRPQLLCHVARNAHRDSQNTYSPAYQSQLLQEFLRTL